MLPLVVVLLALCGSVLVVLFGFGDRFKLGLLEREHPEFFSERQGNLNHTLKYNEDYSWLTQIPVGSDVLQVEHGVPATKGDIERLGLPESKKYIFSSIEVGELNVVDIDFEHSYKGQDLEVEGAFLYLPGEFKGHGKNNKWEIVRILNSFPAQEGPFGYIKVYRVPESSRVSSLIPRRLWFPAPVEESIRVTVSTPESGTKEYSFRFSTYWHKASSFLWRLSWAA